MVTMPKAPVLPEGGDFEQLHAEKTRVASVNPTALRIEFLLGSKVDGHTPTEERMCWPVFLCTVRRRQLEPARVEPEIGAIEVLPPRLHPRRRIYFVPISGAGARGMNLTPSPRTLTTRSWPSGPRPSRSLFRWTLRST